MKDTRSIKEKVERLKELGVNIEIVEEKDMFDEEGEIKTGIILGKMKVNSSI